MYMYIFIWEEDDWSIKAGYVYSPNKAKKIEEILVANLNLGLISWYKSFSLHGYNLDPIDLPNIQIKNGELKLRGD